MPSWRFPTVPFILLFPALAVHLLNDGWLDDYDCAVVVTNDSDIAEGCAS